jgi:glycosyltransferase involved in cell wall biosynthesis
MDTIVNYSIIIPHRNIPELLERLIKSIPRRDDLEIIVVDDHSDEEAVKQLRLMERKNLTLVLNDECHGAGHARNSALPLAKGKWVLFADSDDFFNSGFDEFLSEYADSDVDIVYFNANSVDTDTYEPSNRVDHLHDFISEYQKDSERGNLVMRYLFTEPWCKMVKRNLIEHNDVRFEETIIRNDVRYSYLVGFYAKDIIVDDRQLYCVTTRRNSVSRGVGRQASLDELKVFAGWKHFLMIHKIPLPLPKFDLCLYNFTRHLWKDFKLFGIEYSIMRGAGLPHFFILSQVIKYIWKSIRYKARA